MKAQKTIYDFTEIVENIASAIDNLVLNAIFEEVAIERLQDFETWADLIDKKIIDYRVSTSKDESVIFKGLDFMFNDISTQTYVLKNKIKENIGVFTLILKPKNIVEKARYVTRNDEEKRLYVGNFLSLGFSNSMPDYIFTFGFAKILPEYKKIAAKNSIKMINIYNSIYKLVKEGCPKNTWIEVSAEGMLEYEYRKGFQMKVNQTRIGEYISYSELEFDINKYDFSKNTEGSNITVWLAEKKFKLARQSSNIASPPALGPIFVEKMK